MCKTQMACKISGFKSYRPFVVGPTEMQVSCTGAGTKSQGAHSHVLSNRCDGHSSIFILIIDLYILSMSTQYLVVDVIAGGRKY